MPVDNGKIVGFSFTPIYTAIVDVVQIVYNLEEFLSIIGGSERVLPYIQRITEEEYYKID